MSCLKARLANFVWELMVAFIGVPIAILVGVILACLAVLSYPVEAAWRIAWRISDWAYSCKER